MKRINALIVAGFALASLGCASNQQGPIAPESLPAFSTGVALVAIDIRAIIEAKEPTPEMVARLIDDIDAIIPLITDLEARATAERIVSTIRAVATSVLAVKAVLEGNQDDLRRLRDTLTPRG